MKINLINYFGIEPNELFVETSNKRYKSMNNFKIFKGTAEEIIPNLEEKLTFLLP